MREDGTVFHCPHGRPVAVFLTKKKSKNNLGGFDMSKAAQLIPVVAIVGAYCVWKSALAVEAGPFF